MSRSKRTCPKRGTFTARTPVRPRTANFAADADAITGNNHLIVFGGMAIQPLSDNPEDLCVLNDVRMFDLHFQHFARKNKKHHGFDDW